MCGRAAVQPRGAEIRLVGDKGRTSMHSIFYIIGVIVVVIVVLRLAGFA
jgi:hypothetical protein